LGNSRRTREFSSSE